MIVDGGANVFAHERDVFTEVEAFAQFGDGCLARFHDFGRRGGEEPLGQHAIAGGVREVESNLERGAGA